MGILRQPHIIVNSSILFVVASILEMTLHESGHFVACLMVHAHGISLHHNYVSNLDYGLSASAVIFIKGAGPLVSLLIGMVFQIIVSKQMKRNLLFLFNLYMSAFGYIGFFGYLLVAPMFIEGDTGYVFNALGFPLWLSILIALAGAFVLFLLINRLMKYFVQLGTREIIENQVDREQFIQSLILYPLFIGIVISTLLNLPTPTFLSLIAPICSPFTLLWPYGNALKKHYLLDRTAHSLNEINKPSNLLYLGFIVTIVLNRLLVYGIYAN